MSDMIQAAIAALSEKLDGEDMDFSASFVLGDEGTIRIDQDGTVTESDAEADVTMTADPEVFKGILAGEVNPTSAFMGGDLTVDGDMGLAMKLGSILS